MRPLAAEVRPDTAKSLASDNKELSLISLASEVNSAVLARLSQTFPAKGALTTSVGIKPCSKYA